PRAGQRLAILCPCLRDTGPRRTDLLGPRAIAQPGEIGARLGNRGCLLCNLFLPGAMAHLRGVLLRLLRERLLSGCIGLARPRLDLDQQRPFLDAIALLHTNCGDPAADTRRDNRWLALEKPGERTSFFTALNFDVPSAETQRCDERNRNESLRTKL